jgi:monothiol glutaredoxin
MSTEANPIREAIASAIDEHEVILFMKGTPEAPACGFSARTVAALQTLRTPFAAVDVLPDPRIRRELSAISNWPTIPQLFVRGELVGGCDIVTEMFESGELAETLGAEQEPNEAPAPDAALAPDAAPAPDTAPAADATSNGGFVPLENRLR